MLLMEMARADAMTATKAMEQRMTTFRWTTPACKFKFNDIIYIYLCMLCIYIYNDIYLFIYLFITVSLTFG